MSQNERPDETLLSGLRAEIDALDAQLLAMLNRRARISLKIGECKKERGAPVFSAERERQVVETLRKNNAGPLNALQLGAIYEAIFAVSKEMQSDMRLPEK